MQTAVQSQGDSGLARIVVRVVGWSDRAMRDAEPILSSVADFVSGAYDLGLTFEDIEDDIANSFREHFGDVCVETYDDLPGLFVYLEPVGFAAAV